MKICLINPPRLMKPLSATMKPSPSLGLALIAGALKADGHDISVIDALAEAPNQYIRFHDEIVLNGLNEEQISDLIDDDVDVIAFSMMFSGNWLHNRILIDYLGEKFPKAVLIAGGEHITAAAEFCIEDTEHLHACVCGEGEETISELVYALQNGQSIAGIHGIVYKEASGNIVINPRRTRIKDVENVAWPAWEYFPLEKYKENSIIYGVDRQVYSVPLMATRGCPYRCTFCSSPSMWGTRYYMRSPKDVLDEIELFYNKFQIRNFDFYDLTAIIKKEWIIDFCQQLLARKLDITWQIPAGTRSEAIDQEVAMYLYKSGCVNITYAPESGSEETLKRIKKKVSLNKMLQSIKFSHKENMNIKLNIIIGFPGETHRQIWATMLFVLKASWNGANDMSPSIFSPYPGSQLFDELSKQGKINMKDDQFFYNIIYVDTLFNNYFYNNDIPKFFLRLYHISLLLIFYSSNYLFYPKRFFNLIRNLITKRYESRGEMALGNLIKQSKVEILEKDDPRIKNLTSKTSNKTVKA